MCLHTFLNQCREHKPSLGRGHGKSEPRSVGVLENAHGMTLLLQRTKKPEPQLRVCFAVSSKVKVFRSPSGTFCPKARGLSPQHMWEQAPCVFAARPCFSCPQRMHCMLNATPNQKAKQVPRNLFLVLWSFLANVAVTGLTQNQAVTSLVTSLHSWPWQAATRWYQGSLVTCLTLQAVQTKFLEMKKCRFPIPWPHLQKKCGIYRSRWSSNSRVQRVKTQPLTHQTHKAGQ